MAGMSEQTADKLARSRGERELLLRFVGSVLDSGIFLTLALMR
jgi:hypothetical protein